MSGRVGGWIRGIGGQMGRQTGEWVVGGKDEWMK